MYYCHDAFAAFLRQDIDQLSILVSAFLCLCNNVIKYAYLALVHKHTVFESKDRQKSKEISNRTTIG